MVGSMVGLMDSWMIGKVAVVMPGSWIDDVGGLMAE